MRTCGYGLFHLLVTTHTLPPCGSEKANFALTLTDKNGLLVAQASLYDYPNVVGVDQAAWEKWVPEKFNLPGAVVSLWQHRMSCMYCAQHVNHSIPGPQ